MLGSICIAGGDDHCFGWLLDVTAAPFPLSVALVVAALVANGVVFDACAESPHPDNTKTAVASMPNSAHRHGRIRINRTGDYSLAGLPPARETALNQLVFGPASRTVAGTLSANCSKFALNI